MHYNEYFSKNSSNLKKLWVGVNQIINKRKSSHNPPVCIEIDIEGKMNTVTNPQDIANAFNSHYTKVAEKILSKGKYKGNKSYHSFLKSSNLIRS